MKLTIDRQKWLRGEGGANSFLLRPSDGKQCCLGFLALELGIAKEDILNAKSFQGISAELKPDVRLKLHSLELLDNNGNGRAFYRLAVINDDMSDQLTKEEELKAEFSKLNIDVEFVN